MFFRDKKFQAKTACVVIAALMWLVSGGPAWAAQASAKSNPRGFLLSLAEDSRLSLTAEQRAALRELAARPNAGEILADLTQSPDAGLSAQQRDILRWQSSAASLAGAAGTVRPFAVPAPSAAQTMKQAARDLEEGLQQARAGLKSSRELRPMVSESLALFDEANAEALADFASIEKALRSGGISTELLEEHAAVVADYTRQAQEVRGQLAAGSNGDLAKLGTAVEALKASGEEREHHAFQPTRLPFTVASAEWRLPGEPPLEAAAAKNGADGPPVRSASKVAPLLAAVAASHAPPTPADLAPNPDVQLTPEIQALAASLGNDPLRIYDWVRNNINFYPTWGSVQGAQRTLDMSRGNAADTASLLIALLRSANVPARYVTGTVEIPTAEVRNWLGNAADSSVAQQLLGQGGIANVGLLDGNGDIASIRLEHVWVEAWVDNVPGRGAVHREGDTWLPLDAAFKQHQFTGPSDVFTAVPLDTAIASAPLPFTVDESLGKITNVNPDGLDAALEQWAEASDDYIINNGVEQSFDGVLGGKEILPLTSTVFAASLPYGVVKRADPVAQLPSSMRHSIRLRGFRSVFGQASGSPTFDVTLSLPELDAKRLNLTFLPATLADADILAAARSNGASSLPVYLVDVIPAVEVDGVEIARGAALGMGSTFWLDIVLKEPGRSSTVPFQVIAGDEIIVGVTGNGVNETVVEKRFNAFPVDNAPEYFHQVQLHYWTEADYLGEVAASRRGVHPLRLPSVGLFSSTLSVSTFFGAPRSAVYAGRTMDIQRSFVGAAGADPVQVVSWVKQSGLQGSYLEGSVFEQLEQGATGTARPSGISSVHLISAAAAQGVPIYRITSANAAAVQPLLNLPSAVERDIANALAAGQSVLAPESAIDLGPYQGVGYILQDEQTGAGAYLISGGLAGGGFLDCLRELVPIFQFILVLLLILLLLLLLILLILSAPVSVPAFATAAAVFLAFMVSLRGLGPTTAPGTA